MSSLVEVEVPTSGTFSVEVDASTTVLQLTMRVLHAAGRTASSGLTSSLSCGPIRLKQNQVVAVAAQHVPSNGATFVLTDFSEFGPKGPGQQPLWMPAAERGITLTQLEEALSFVRLCAPSWCETAKPPVVPAHRHGQRLSFDEVNLYHLNDWMLAPATAGYCNPEMPDAAGCSWVELLAEVREAQKPSWFMSHAWSEPLVCSMACLRRHASIRELSADGACYWVCAFANNQHNLGMEVASDPRETSFFKAMMSCAGVLLILNQEAAACSRIWCCFEIYVALDRQYMQQNQGREPLLLDIATPLSSAEAELLTDSLAGPEQRMAPLLAYQAKSAREASFPVPLVSKGLQVDIATAAYTKVEDQRRILNTISGSLRLDDPPPTAHANYDQVNCALRSKLALSAWPACIQQGLDCRFLTASLAADTTRRSVDLSFLGMTGFTDSELQRLVSALPKSLPRLRLDLCLVKLQDLAGLQTTLEQLTELRELELRFTGCQDLRSVEELVVALPKLKNLIQLELWLSHCPSLESIGKLPSVLRKLPVLRELVLNLSGCTQLLLEPCDLLKSVMLLHNFGKLGAFRLDLTGCSRLPLRFQSCFHSNRPADVAFVAGCLWALPSCGASRPPVTERTPSGGGPVLLGRSCLEGKSPSPSVSSASPMRLGPTWEEALAAPFPCSRRGCLAFHRDPCGRCPQHRRRWTWDFRRLQLACQGLQLLFIVGIMGALEVDNAWLLCLLFLSWSLALATSLWATFGPVPAVVVLTLVLILLVSAFVSLRRLESMGRTFEGIEHQVEVLLCKQLSRHGSSPTSNGLQLSCLGPSSGTSDPSVASQKELEEIYAAARCAFALFESVVDTCSPMPAAASARLAAIHGKEDGRQPLQGDIVCEDLQQVCECWAALQHLTSRSPRLRFLSVSNGFRDSRAAGGYRCLEVVLRVDEAEGKLRVHVESLQRLYDKADRIYELARDLGLLASKHAVTPVEEEQMSKGTAIVRGVAQVVRLIACAVASFFAVKYFQLYLTQQGEITHTSLALSMPHAMTAALLLANLCREFRHQFQGSLPRLQPTGAVTRLYRQYLGVMGQFFVWKIAGTQCLEVALQATGKLGLLGALTTNMESSGTDTNGVTAGYWTLILLLVVNCVYPATLFIKRVQESPTLRGSVCLLDAMLGLGYMCTYLACILLVLPQLQWHSQVWDENSQVWKPVDRQMSPKIAFPTQPLGYIAVYWPTMRAFALCRALDSLSTSFATRQLRAGSGRKKALNGVLRGLGIAGYTFCMVSFVALIAWWTCRDRYPFQRPDAQCFPCRCDAGQLTSCGVASDLQIPILDLSERGLSSIATGALWNLPFLEQLSLQNNSLSQVLPEWFSSDNQLQLLDLSLNPVPQLQQGAFRNLGLLRGLSLESVGLQFVSPGAFDGLDKLRSLSLVGNHVDFLAPGAFGGIQLTELWMHGNRAADPTGCNHDRMLPNLPSCIFGESLCGWTGPVAENTFGPQGPHPWPWAWSHSTTNAIKLRWFYLPSDSITLESPYFSSDVRVDFTMRLFIPAPVHYGAVVLEISEDRSQWKTFNIYSTASPTDRFIDFGGPVPASMHYVRLLCNISSTDPSSVIMVDSVTFSRSGNCASHVGALNKGSDAIRFAVALNESSQDCFPCFCVVEAILSNSFGCNPWLHPCKRLERCLAANAFSYTDLELSNRYITAISPDAFADLRDLVTVDLSANELSFLDLVFLNSTAASLQHLWLAGNPNLNLLVKCSAEGLGDCAQDLDQVDASGHIMAGFMSKDCYPCRCSVVDGVRRLETCPPFATMINLSKHRIGTVAAGIFDAGLEMLRGLQLNHSLSTWLPDNTLRNFDLSSNGLFRIERGAFSKMHNVTINLAHNHLCLDRDLVWGLPFAGKDLYIYLTGNSEIPTRALSYCKEENLENQCSGLVSILQTITSYECYPCRCTASKEGGLELVQCSAVPMLQEDVINLTARAISYIAPGALDPLVGTATELLLSGNPAVSSLPLNITNFMPWFPQLVEGFP